MNRLLGRVDAHLGGPGEFAGAVDDAGFQYARPDFGAIVETRDAFQESIGIVSHVARAGHTVREIKRAIDVTEMLVVIPQSWHQEAAVRIDDLGIRGRFYVAVRRDAHDAITAHQHTHSRGDTKIARIEQTRVADHEIAFRNVRKIMRQTCRPGVVGRLLRFLQLRDAGSAAPGRPRTNSIRCRCIAVVVEPDRLRREAKASNAILSQVALAGCALTRVCRSLRYAPRRQAAVAACDQALSAERAPAHREIRAARFAGT